MNNFFIVTEGLTALYSIFQLLNQSVLKTQTETIDESKSLWTGQ